MIEEEKTNINNDSNGVVTPAMDIPDIPFLDTTVRPTNNAKSLGIIGLTTLVSGALAAGSIYVFNKIVKKKRTINKIHTFDNNQSNNEE